jgi:polysaccharide pyruvyl transferase WcaK-like protein
MRILIDSSNYFIDNDNIGDRAIYQVIARRLLALWPDVQIQFITLNPALIYATHPKLTPLFIGSVHGYEWFDHRDNEQWRAEEVPWAQRPSSQRKMGARMIGDLRSRATEWRGPTPELEAYLEAVERADLTLATGGGYYSDAFARHARGILDTLEGAVQQRKPAVMMGAGFESVRDARLLAKAKSVLPRLASICCRERLFGPPHLQSLGVSPDCIAVTGDDAVELAYEKRAPVLGNGIGVNLRQAEYSGIDDVLIDVLRSALHAAARNYDATLLPIPISLYGPSDVVSIQKLLQGFDDDSDVGRMLDTPQAVLQQVRRCRIVVTGSYHAGVFGLSQGVSVVAIVKSLHYVTKMQGLAAQFNGGCTVVSLDDPNLGDTLAQAIATAWKEAERKRPGLLRAAEDQIEAGRAAYRQVYHRVS